MKVKIIQITFDEMVKTGLKPDVAYEVVKDLGNRFIIKDEFGAVHNIDKIKVKEVTWLL